MEVGLFIGARPPRPRKRVAGLSGTWRECPPRVAVDLPTEYTPDQAATMRRPMHKPDDEHEPDHEHDSDHDHAPGQGHDHPAMPATDGRPRIAFIGAGRVGTVLAVAFARAGWQVTGVASRDEERRAAFVGLVAGARGFAEAHAVLDEAELIFLTVPDDAVAGVAGEPAPVQRPGARPHQRRARGVGAGAGDGGWHERGELPSAGRVRRPRPGAAKT